MFGVWMQEMLNKNATLSENMMQNANILTQNIYDNLDKNLAGFSEKLNTQLSSIAKHNEELMATLAERLSTFSTTLSAFDTSTKGNFENLISYFKTLCTQYVKLMQASMQANIKSQDSAAKEINNAISSIKESVSSLTDSSSSLFNKQQEMLDGVILHFKNNTNELVKQGREIHENLGNNLVLLDSKMEKMTDSFANNYEIFIKKVRELMGSPA